jgi:hypothetical protein
MLAAAHHASMHSRPPTDSKLLLCFYECTETVPEVLSDA